MAEKLRERALQSRIRRKGDARTRAVELYDYKTAHAQMHLPLEHAAPPCAVTPPASVAFVRPIPRYSGTHGAYSESLEKVPRKRPLSIRRRNAISCATFAALPVESVALARGSDRVLRRVAPVSGFRNR